MPTRRGLGKVSTGLAMAVPLAGALAGSGAGLGPSWPGRPLHWLVGYPPGGASDVFARLVAAEMGTRLGQAVVVENRPGGGAVLASDLVARAAPDGLTWLHVDNGILVYNPALYARLPLDPDRDLAAVGFIGRFPLFLAVRPDHRAGNLAGFAAATDGRVPTYGSPGIASPHHLAMEMLRRIVGFEATHVPYRGGPAAMQDLLAGAVDGVMIDSATGLPFLRSGRARALVTLGETRSAAAPDVPTALELSHAGAVAYGWQGLAVPAATPAPIVARLNAVLNDAVASEAVRARTGALGVERAPWSPAEFAAFVAQENARWRPLIRQLGIRLDG